ncbi:MAG: histidinol-phosphatase [Bacillota bacterium]
MWDYHMHLERGAQSVPYIERFMARAAEVGITEIGVTEHLYRFREARSILWDGYVASRSVNTVGAHVSLMERARDAGIPVKFGIEADYIPGKEREIQRVLKMFPLDYAIGSVHWLGGWAFDLNARDWEGRSLEAIYRQYYETLGRAAESGLFDVIGHPGNIAYFGYRAPAPLLLDLEEEFLSRVVRLPVALEINSGGLLRPAKELFPRPEMARRIAGLGIPVTTGSDAHRPEDVGHDFPNLYRQMREWGFTEVCGFDRCRRIPHPISSSVEGSA